MIFHGLSLLASYWRRHPFQLATLLTGLVLATGLWTGVQAVNVEARASYALAEAATSPPTQDILVSSESATLPVSTYLRLQAAGWRTSPVFERRVRIGRNSVRVIGIDALTYPAGEILQGLAQGEAVGQYLQNVIGTKGRLLAHPDTAQDVAANGIEGLIQSSDQMPPNTLIGDFSAIARMLPNGETTIEAEGFSRLIVLDGQPANQASLSRFADIIRTDPASRIDTAELTDSFHLNLTAFGFLSFVVGMFVVYGIIMLSFEQRRQLFRTMRLLGFSRRQLLNSLLVELLALSLLGGALGVASGYFLAAWLLPDVAATLQSLYGATVSGALHFRPQWWISGIAIAVLGTAIASLNGIVSTIRLTILEAGQVNISTIRQIFMFRLEIALAVAFLIASAGILLLGSGLAAGFAALAFLLIGSALALPPLLALALRLVERFEKGAVWEWFIADARLQLTGLSVALMALLMAASANIGVSTMVGSFRSTFIDWLDKRLVAEIYVSGRSEAEAGRISDWLAPKVDAILPVRNEKAQLSGAPGEIVGMADHATYRDYWPLTEGQEKVWDQVFKGDAALVNEQLALRLGLRVGDRLNIEGDLPLEIAGIYADYGNPSIEAIIALNLFEERFPNADKRRFVVRVDPKQVSGLIGEIRTEFGLPATNIANQKAVKDLSRRIFERTFLVTAALNGLTLTVAVFALFTSLVTLSGHRLPQLAPLWAMGLTRRQLAALELGRALTLALLTGLIAIPVGLMIGWVLLAVVNVEAFGWRLPFLIFPRDWAVLVGFSLVAAMIAAAYPAARLSRIAPADLLRSVSDVR